MRGGVVGLTNPPDDLRDWSTRFGDSCGEESVLHRSEGSLNLAVSLMVVTWWILEVHTHVEHPFDELSHEAWVVVSQDDSGSVDPRQFGDEISYAFGSRIPVEDMSEEPFRVGVLHTQDVGIGLLIQVCDVNGQGVHDACWTIGAGPQLYTNWP